MLSLNTTLKRPLSKQFQGILIIYMDDHPSILSSTRPFDYLECIRKPSWANNSKFKLLAASLIEEDFAPRGTTNLDPTIKNPSATNPPSATTAKKKAISPETAKIVPSFVKLARK